MSSIIKAENISKRFSDNRILASSNVDFEIEEGEIHAVAGENGSGKSTIMHIISGLIRPDSGKLFLKNRETVYKSPADALADGIGMIHQIPGIISGFTALDNIVLGSRSPLLTGINRKSLLCELETVKDEFGIDIDLLKIPSSPRERQYTLLIALIYLNMNIIILDEPTSAFTEIESGYFFKTIKKLKEKGKTIVFITHKIKTALSLADRITVFSKGENKGTLNTNKADIDTVASLIIGGNKDTASPPTFTAQPAAQTQGNTPVQKDNKIIFRVIGAETIADKDGNHGDEPLKTLDFNVKEGEIFSFTGIRDNNLDHLEDILGGFKAPGRGKILFKGEDITGFSIGELRKKGIIYIPSDRIGRGTSLMTTVENNIALTHIDEVSDKGFISKTRLKAFFNAGKDTFSINALYGQPLWQLSGGNIQKVILFRELYKANKLLIICEPAWNLDINSRNMIYEELFRLKKEGTTIIIISTDIDEVVDLSDRAAVMYKGEIAGIFESPDINSMDIGRMMLGLYKEEETKNCPF